MKYEVDGIFFSYRQPKATAHVIDNFLQHYPASKIFLFVDKGGLVPELGNLSRYVEIVVQKRRISARKNGLYLSISTYRRYLKSLVESSQKNADSNWLFILEDDVKVFSHVEKLEYDLNGVNLNEYFPFRIRLLFLFIGGRKNCKTNIGGFGGSIIKKSILQKHSIKVWSWLLLPFFLLSGRPLGSDQVLTIMNFLSSGTSGTYPGLYETWQDTYKEALYENKIVTLHKFRENYD